jgi:hypothetical protein
MEYNGRPLEQPIDIASPLREKRAASKILHMRLQRSPYIDYEILPGLLDTTFYAGRNASWMLANNFKTL